MKARFIAPLAVLSLVLGGCDQAPPEKTNAAPKAQAKASAAAHGHDGHDGHDDHKGHDHKAGGHGKTPKQAHGAAPTQPAGVEGDLKWKMPEAWKEVPHPSKMRKVTYQIPRAAGDPDDAQMSVTQVGGSVPENIQRWEGQFSEKPKAKTVEKEVGGVKVTIVELGGTFAGGGPAMGGSGKTQTDWAMLSAIVHTSPAHFFKMTGPKKTVTGSRKDFDLLVASFALKK